MKMKVPSRVSDISTVSNLIGSHHQLDFLPSYSRAHNHVFNYTIILTEHKMQLNTGYFYIDIYSDTTTCIAEYRDRNDQYFRMVRTGLYYVCRQIGCKLKLNGHDEIIEDYPLYFNFVFIKSDPEYRVVTTYIKPINYRKVQMPINGIENTSQLIRFLTEDYTRTGVPDDFEGDEAEIPDDYSEITYLVHWGKLAAVEYNKGYVYLARHYKYFCLLNGIDIRKIKEL